MMKTRVLSFLAAFLIITVAFTVAFMDPVSADDDPEDWEPDNDEAIYLRPANTEEKNYNYNYTDVALEEDVDFDCEYSTNEYSYDSEMSLTAHVHEVMSSERYNFINIAISAPGAYRYNEEESDNPNDLAPWLGHIGTLGTAIEAEITGMEGWEDKPGEAPPRLLMHPEYNSADNFTDGDVGCEKTGLSEWQKLAIEGAILTAETAIDFYTLNALSWAQYASKVVSTYAEDDPIDPLPEHEISDSYNGKEASVSQSWEHHRTDQGDREYHLFNLDYSEYEEHLEEGDDVDQELIDAFDEKGHKICDDWYGLEKEDDGEWSVNNENGGFFILKKDEEKLKIYGGDIPLERAHTASTEIGFRLPTDDLPDEATLEISAKNILGTADADGDIIQDADGAEATVEIPIKNAEQELDEDHDRVDGPVYASDFLGDNYIYPDIGIDDLENRANCHEAEYVIDVYYKHDDMWDFEFTRERTKTIGSDYLYSIEMELPDEYDGDVEIRLTITTKDEYGAWEKEVEDTFNAINECDDDDPPGGGGGGWSPIHPYGDS